MHRKLSIVLLLINACTLRAQFPNTELWLFKIETTKTGRLLKDPLNITMREGYDNQPTFSTDGKKIWYVSIREDKQADIYYYDLKKKKNIRFSSTPLSEYSPVESVNSKYLTSVVVESDSAQCVHFINAVNGLHENKINIDSVGYYTFLNADTMIYYKLTNPHSLRYRVLNTQEDKWLGDFPIRTFKAVDRSTVIYGLRDSGKVTFYKYSFLLQKAERYTDYPSQSEDITWHPVWGLIKSEGTKLLRFDEQKKEWTILFDLSGFNLKKITRFGFDPRSKYLVVVENL